MVEKKTTYFETENECDAFKSVQKCRVKKFYDTTTQSYYLILSTKYDWLNREIEPNLSVLLPSQKLYSNYCNIVKDIQYLSYNENLSQYEKEKLPKLLKQFNKFRDETRQQYDEN